MEDGVRLGARFSLATNRLQYCGPADAEPALYRAITRGEALPEAARALRGFEALTPYLDFIAGKHGRDPLDREVVEAYWIGNTLLDAFERDDFLDLIESLVRRGLPRSLARRLSDHLPSRPIPHHAFHVCYVGVGNVTGHVETTLANMELCRPAWGTVEEVAIGKLRVRKPSLATSAGTLYLGPEAPIELAFDPLVLPGVRPGSTVALHWNWPALELDAARSASLRRYTELSLAAANEALPSLRVLG